MLWDTHMHTHFSGDSDADPTKMARAAIARNLDGICITDHLDYDYPDDPDLFNIKKKSGNFRVTFPIP